MMPHALPQPGRMNGQIPVLGQQRQVAEAQIMQAVQGLSLTVYSRIAAEMLDPEKDANPEHLRHLAKGSMIAARAYFEGLGVIERQEGAKPTDGAAIETEAPKHQSPPIPTT